MKITLFTLLTTCLLAAASSSFAQAPTPMPKIFAGIPADKASWTIEMLELPGDAAAKGMKGMGPMTVCNSAAQALARRDGRPNQPACSTKLLEDGATRAVMEISCSGDDPMTMKNTITKIADKSFDITSESSSKARPAVQRSRVKMSYAGACSEKDAAVKMGKDSPMCQQIAPQLAQMDPAKCPKGPNGQACVQQMTQARTQLEAMCR